MHISGQVVLISWPVNSYIFFLTFVLDKLDFCPQFLKTRVRILGDDQQKNLQVGRSFLVTDPLISEISRDSIDALKANFEDEMKEDGDTVQHLGELKRYFNVI